MTNVPAIQFTPTGLVIPQAGAVLAGVQVDIDRAFGGDVNPELETPQGQLATSEAAIINDKNAQIAYIVGQMNPDSASGAFQDVIGRIYFIDRIPGAPTVVQCVCTGGSGVVIPTGVQAEDTSGNLYVCVAGGQIGVSGNITLQFANIQDGPIPCPANTLAKIRQVIPGWDDINNPVEGIVGRDVESRTDFEYRRRQSVALNAHGSPEAVYAEVFDVDDVLDVYVYDNTTNAVLPVGATNYPMVPHSLYVAAIGGSPAAVASAIWRKKDLGCNYNGNTEIVVTDPSGYAYPPPTYVVKYEIPPPLPIKFDVQIVGDPNLPADVVQLIKAAIVNAFNGTTEGSTRARIGQLLVGSRYVQYVQRIDPNMAVLSILLGAVAPTESSFLVGIDQAPTTSAADVTVTLV